jgi:isopentenyl-diphosphate delta-isomerase
MLPLYFNNLIQKRFIVKLKIKGEEMTSQTEGRKSDHIKICLREDVQAKKATSGFEDVFLVHRALPEIDRGDIEFSSIVFNHKFFAPIIVEAITGGVEKSLKINASIAEAVEELGLGMGVGSQRAAIENPKLEKTFAIARKKAPNAFLISNIGGPQLVKGYGAKEAKKAVEMINADALAIHLNPLQEVVQPEGETNFHGVLKKICEIVQALDVPVIVKETGAGIASEDAKILETAGVCGIDVAGVGGTSWAAVEYYRAKERQNEFHQRIGQTFWDWGIPTAISLVEVAQSTHLPIIASGGVHNGENVAKALVSGANLAGTASPILQAATNGQKEVKKVLTYMIEELRNTMFLVGAKSIDELKNVPAILTGKTAEWLTMRGFHPEEYARRKM